MDITWLGHSCFRIKGKEVALVTDPYDATLRYSWPKTSANIVTVSHPHPGHGNAAAVEGSPKVVNRPGEYEIKNVFIIGFPTFHDVAQGANRGRNVTYLMEMEDLKLCHLGDIGHTPSAKQIEELSGIDILFAPVGGVSTIDAKTAAEIVRLLNPKIVIPMHYQTDVTNWLEPLEKFTTGMGLREVVPQPKLTVTKANVPLETRVVILDYRSK
jgi:L-ascorbate metabolism protein UlaG (beta-lactamase superfamily)